ncbi:hypothetical protein [Endozoicomonas sp. SESOKO1]|uniref:hypothetical protein n=1 Tax=Endozoicomonas sp. SESOKO1 TaxID=2828742 RepID=UPI0021491249|nr:hypothetical protein [Endozoicomonas sp. SESOKO1]
MNGLQHTTVLRINDPAFDNTSVTAYVGADGEIGKAERDNIPDDFATAYGRMVKEVESKSIFQEFKDTVKYSWEQTKVVFRKIGVLLGIIPEIPKVTQETHPNVFHPEQAQRDIHNPLLKELKNNSPKLKSVTGSSIKDLERKRERMFQEQTKAFLASPVAEMKLNPPKLSSEFCHSINYLENKRAEKFSEFIKEEQAQGELSSLKHSVKSVTDAAARKAENDKRQAAHLAWKAEFKQRQEDRREHARLFNARINNS